MWKFCREKGIFTQVSNIIFPIIYSLKGKFISVTKWRKSIITKQSNPAQMTVIWWDDRHALPKIFNLNLIMRSYISSAEHRLLYKKTNLVFMQTHHLKAKLCLLKGKWKFHSGFNVSRNDLNKMHNARLEIGVVDE